jgi:hypothetical protein
LNPAREEHFFRVQAAECRRQAEDLPPGETRRQMEQLAGHYEGEARRRTLETIRARQY